MQRKIWMFTQKNAMVEFWDNTVSSHWKLWLKNERP